MKMARFWKIYEKFYLYCFVIIIIPDVFAIEDYYFYNTDDSSSTNNERITLRLHSINKRQATNLSEQAVQAVAETTTTTNFKLAKIGQGKVTIPLFTSTKKDPDKTTVNSNVDQKLTTSMNNLTNYSNKTVIDDGLDDDVSISKFTDSSANFNKTLLEHDVTKTQVDTHLYYNSTTFQVTDEMDTHYWMNMSARDDVIINDMLSKSHRRATTVKLSFDFPFYGHPVRNITIATGGFLYTGEYIHSWLAATQYVAPLMANFDTSMSNNSFIKYVDNGTAFTVQWERVLLQDRPNVGEFTFQATLHKSGDIVFVYKDVPLFIQSIGDSFHPVKVGLSDAYVVNKTIFFVHRKTIYEYHRVQFKRGEIKNGTVIYLNPLPTCLDSKDCVSCVNNLLHFECNWCRSTNRCSNGFDRYRQDWLTKGCDRNQIMSDIECSLTEKARINKVVVEDVAAASRVTQDDVLRKTVDQPVKMSVSTVLASFLFVALISSMTIWVLYAYKNPHSTSGQILIKYRPSQWRWRRGEARYTAATIHM